MKIVKRLRRVTVSQVSKLRPSETRMILDQFNLTQSPVDVKRAAIGTTVRPESATLVNGVETVESFLARGGRINVAKPTKVTEPTIRVKGSRNMANTQMKGARTVKSIEGNK